MIVLMDAQCSRIEHLASEMRLAEWGATAGQLLTPRRRHTNCGSIPFAIDNCAYSGFDSEAFRSLLDREKPRRDKCMWVAVPDVVGSARRTSETFEAWYPKLCGWPLAFVAQDGQEDLPIPWKLIQCVFIGGSTTWKLSSHAEQIIAACKIIGCRVHVGRVNTAARVEKFFDLGVDSIDGSGLVLPHGRATQERSKIGGRMTSPVLFTSETNHADSIQGLPI